MYIQKAKIRNIRSVVDFEIDFKKLPGWHVLIGDNGSGKSTIIRSFALALVGAEEGKALRQNWDDWLNKQNRKANDIILTIVRDPNLDETEPQYGSDYNTLRLETYFDERFPQTLSIYSMFLVGIPGSTHFRDAEKKCGFFSAAFGPYRRFEGGNSEWDEVFSNQSLANLSAHLSGFGEDVALTESTAWLIGLFNTSTDHNFPKEQVESANQLENIKKLINWEDESGSFLPNGTKLETVNSKGAFFRDGNGMIISVNQMSDGYRSVLSMTFELIRQLVRVYGSRLVFSKIEKGKMIVDLPGVVLVDEIDAHLHPTWQTRIGHWFLKFFPKIQFIVTTHSPLVCRAAENGSIWRLAAPGSDGESGEITGLDRDRLIHGNILDAYGTEVFGENVSISEDSNDMLNRLAELNVKSMMGEIEEAEHAELENLKAVLPTESNL
jgi:ABC-type oligopeptide transport system ATPase subunit